MTKYRALHFIGDQRAHGWVHLHARKVHFSAWDASNKKFDWDEFETLATYEAGVLALHSKAKPSESIYIEDKSFAEELEKYMDLTVQPYAKHWVTQRPVTAAFLATMALVAAAFGSLALMR